MEVKMIVKITASCMWKVSKEDEEIARDLIRDKPGDIILDYLQDALMGNDKELLPFQASVEELED